MFALVIEASAVMRQRLVSTLEALGWEVSTAHNGRDALLQLNVLPYCDLIFADWHLPDMDGLQLCRAVRNAERHPFAPIIMTAYDVDTDAMREAVYAGANALISKPVARQVLQQRMVAVMSSAFQGANKQLVNSAAAA